VKFPDADKLEPEDDLFWKCAKCSGQVDTILNNCGCKFCFKCIDEQFKNWKTSDSPVLCCNRCSKVIALQDIIQLTTKDSFNDMILKSISKSKQIQLAKSHETKQ